MIRVENPVFAYIQLLEYFSPKKQCKSGIHNTAIISKSAQIGQNVSIGPYAVIGSNVKINFESESAIIFDNQTDEALLSDFIN